MQTRENPLLLTRRGVLLLAGAGLAWSAEYWDKKPPEDWSRDEIDKLLNKSPWAKEVTAQARAEQNGGYGSPGGGNSSTTLSRSFSRVASRVLTECNAQPS